MEYEVTKKENYALVSYYLISWMQTMHPSLKSEFVMLSSNV
jgi:hypothetical protein